MVDKRVTTNDGGFTLEGLTKVGPHRYRIDTDLISGSDDNGLQLGGDDTFFNSIVIKPEGIAGPISFLVNNGDTPWVMTDDGGLNTPVNFTIYPVSGVPDNGDGSNGDWSISDNGHMYFKTGGSWTQKV